MRDNGFSILGLLTIQFYYALMRLKQLLASWFQVKIMRPL